MTKRSPQEVGQLVRQRREWLGLTQESAGISSALVKQIERGTAPLEGRGSTRSAFMRALHWPHDALERLAAGEDPDTFTQGTTADTAPPWEQLLQSQRKLTETIERLADLIEGR